MNNYKNCYWYGCCDYDCLLCSDYNPVMEDEELLESFFDIRRNEFIKEWHELVEENLDNFY